MANERKIGVIVGSLRKGSLNRLTARALIGLAPEQLKFEVIEIGQLPLYNQDEDADPPAAWTAFRDTVRVQDAILFVTPEYNRSVPGVLKNAIDVGSRPYGKSAWQGKPSAIVSVSPGALGAFGANHHLRQALVFLDMPCMAQPEAYVGNAAHLFAPDGSLGNDGTREFLRKFMQAFAAWVERNR